jgi:hypothetical protein
MPSTAIFIPSYNAAHTLPSVIERIPAEFWPQVAAVFVINDGSADDTDAVVQKLCERWPKLRLQGSRHKAGTARAGGMPYYKWLAGQILTWMENKTFGLSMTDYHSGYMLYSQRAARSIPFDELSYYFDFDLEVIASARARGLRVDELGIPTHYGDEKSYLNPIWYGLRCLRVMLRYRLGRYAA